MHSAASSSFEWYYIGHYGQLGPLSADQMLELIVDGVVSRETYVWRAGLREWQPAGSFPELMSGFAPGIAYGPPPAPPPMPARVSSTMNPYSHIAPAYAPLVPSYPLDPPHLHGPLPLSDRNRIIAGLLQLIFPGVGRMYLGYSAMGVLQLFLLPCGFGAGWIWSFIDGILILSGAVKLDGYGRRLPD